MLAFLFLQIWKFLMPKFGRGYGSNNLGGVGINTIHTHYEEDFSKEIFVIQD
jgi:hypothetical protein